MKLKPLIGQGKIRLMRLGEDGATKTVAVWLSVIDIAGSLVGLVGKAPAISAAGRMGEVAKSRSPLGERTATSAAERSATEGSRLPAISAPERLISDCNVDIFCEISKILVEISPKIFVKEIDDEPDGATCSVVVALLAERPTPKTGWPI